MVSGAGHFGKKSVETLCCAFGNWMEQFEPKKLYVEKTMFMCDVPVSAPMGWGGSLNESSLVGNLQRRNQANLFQTGLVPTA